MVFDHVVVRVSSNFSLECHIDMDEANAADVKTGAHGYLFGISNEERPAAAVQSTENFKSEQPLKLVTEDTVRDALKKNVKLKVCKDTIYTPLARDAIKEWKAEAILTTASIRD